MGGLRERLDTLTRGELAGLVAVIVTTLAAGGLWYVRSLPKPVEVAVTTRPSPVAALATPSSSASVVPSDPQTLIVDVTGWVRDPGVYGFRPGDRVVDAVQRAGGARRGADLSLLNLAAPLSDGQQVLVPRRGQPVPVAPGSVTSGAPVGPIDVNTADAAMLETLNGIGEVLAAAIVTYRDEHGPFTSVDQLVDVPGIGPATLEELRDQVTI
jgi:competence protein ComEA